MTAFIDALLVFVALLGLVFGLGCAVSALHPRNHGKAFFQNTFFAAASLTVSLACAWDLIGRLR